MVIGYFVSGRGSDQNITKRRFPCVYPNFKSFLWLGVSDFKHKKHFRLLMGSGAVLKKDLRRGHGRQKARNELFSI